MARPLRVTSSGGKKNGDGEFRSPGRLRRKARSEGRGEGSGTVPSDTTPPQVAITSPEDGALVSGFVWVEVGASDEVAVDSLRLEIDGTPVAFSDSGALRHKWDTRRLADTHVITVVATDSAGNRGEATARVTVDGAKADGGGSGGNKGRGRKK